MIHTGQRKRFLSLGSLFIILMLVIAACGLTGGGDDEEEAQTDLLQNVNNILTQTVQARRITQTAQALGNPTQTPTPTSTPLSNTTGGTTSGGTTTGGTTGGTTTGGTTGGTIPNCTVRADWLAYTVQPGDTLGGLADEIGTTVNNLATGNCLANASVIFVGQQLRLPTLPTGDGDGSTTCQINTAWDTYTIQRGDTLAIIAGEFNTTVDALVVANCLPNPDLIEVGEALRVPPSDGTTTGGSTTGGTSDGGSCTPRSDWSIYTVEQGDTIASIAIDVGVTVTALVGGNCLESTIIQVNQQLRVPELPDGADGSSGGVEENIPEGDPPTILQGLAIQPTLTDNGDIITLQAEIALNVGVVEDADRVRYFLGETTNQDSAINFATDEDPFDGTQVTYTFNSFDDGSSLFFWAIASNEFGTTTVSAVEVLYASDYTSAPTGSITISPSIGFDGGLYTLQYGANVTVLWSGAPTNASRVEFYLTENNVSSLIGTDTAPSNGTSISWTVPEWTLGTITARAFRADNSTVNSNGVNVFAEGDTPQGDS